GSLYGSQTRQDKIEQDERIGIELLSGHDDHIESHPCEQHDSKNRDKGPAAAERGEMIRQAFAKRAMTCELGFNIFRQCFVIGETLHHLLLELGQFAAFLAEQIRDVARPKPVKVLAADMALPR